MSCSVLSYRISRTNQDGILLVVIATQNKTTNSGVYRHTGLVAYLHLF